MKGPRLMQIVEFHRCSFCGAAELFAIDVWYEYAPEEKWKLCPACHRAVADGTWTRPRFAPDGMPLTEGVVFERERDRERTLIESGVIPDEQ